MIDRKTAQEACRQLHGMRMTPDKDEISRRLDALIEHGRSAGHADRVVREIRRTDDYYPTVARLIEVCESLPDDPQAFYLRRDCPYCAGTGWIIVGGPFLLTAAAPCNHSGMAENQGMRLSAGVEAIYSENQRDGQKRRELAELKAERRGK